MDDLTIRGVWWLPHDRERTAGGTLTFTSTEGAALELFGSFTDENSLGQESSFEPRFVHGVTTEGKRVTLYECHVTHRHFNIGSGVRTTGLSAMYLFVGEHFSDDHDLSFIRFAVEFDQLSNWAWVSGFQYTITQDSETKAFKRFEVSYEFPDPNVIVVDALEIRFAPNYNQNVSSISKYVLEQKMYLEVRPNSAQTFEFFQDLFYHLRNFITLGVGRPVYPTSIRATVSVDIPEGSKLERTHDVEVYYATRDEHQRDELVNRPQMLFNLEDIRPFYQEALTQWLNKAEALSPVYDLYFSTLYNTKLYLEGRFLSLAQALETYHRRMVGGTYFSEAKYAEIHGAFIAALSGFKLDTDTRNTFKGKLQYLNEFSLRKRVKDIVASLGDLVAEFIPNAGKFSSRVVDTRNYLTHYNASLRNNAAHGEELYHLSELLRFLLELCLLRELGLPEEVRTKLVAKHRGYRKLRAP